MSTREKKARQVGGLGYGGYASLEDWATRIDVVFPNYPYGTLQGDEAIKRSIQAANRWLPGSIAPDRADELFDLRKDRQAHVGKLGALVVGRRMLEDLAGLGDRATLENFARFAAQQGPDGRGLWILDADHIVCAYGGTTIFTREEDGAVQRRVMASVLGGEVEISDDDPVKDKTVRVFQDLIGPNAEQRLTPPESALFIASLLAGMPERPTAG